MSFVRYCIIDNQTSTKRPYCIPYGCRPFANGENIRVCLPEAALKGREQHAEGVLLLFHKQLVFPSRQFPRPFTREPFIISYALGLTIRRLFRLSRPITVLFPVLPSLVASVQPFDYSKPRLR